GVRPAQGHRVLVHPTRPAAAGQDDPTRVRDALTGANATRHASHRDALASLQRDVDPAFGLRPRTEDAPLRLIDGDIVDARLSPAAWTLTSASSWVNGGSGGRLVTGILLSNGEPSFSLKSKVENDGSPGNRRPGDGSRAGADPRRRRAAVLRARPATGRNGSGT